MEQVSLYVQPHIRVSLTSNNIMCHTDTCAILTTCTCICYAFFTALQKNLRAAARDEPSLEGMFKLCKTN